MFTCILRTSIEWKLHSKHNPSDFTGERGRSGGGSNVGLSFGVCSMMHNTGEGGATFHLY